MQPLIMKGFSSRLLITNVNRVYIMQYSTLGIVINDMVIRNGKSIWPSLPPLSQNVYFSQFHNLNDLGKSSQSLFNVISNIT